MKPHESLAPPQRRRFAVLLVSILLLVSHGDAGLPVTAQTTPNAQSPPDEQERKFENTIPDHAPIKVKLKNERAFVDMKNRDWVRDLEIEVRNVGDKPIYFLLLNIILPDVTVGGVPYALQLHYGRMELFRLDATIQPDDVPLRPGETIIVRVPEKQVVGYEYCRDHECAADAKKVPLDFGLINFGDGTGLRGTDARPYPKPRPSN